MKVKATVKNKTNLKKVKQKTQKANFKSLDHAAAIIRNNIIKDIKQGTVDTDGKRKPSKPGKKPKGWENKRTDRALKKCIYFDVNRSYGCASATIYARPLQSGDQVFQMHEYGGSQQIEKWKYTDVVDNRKYRRDERPDWKAKPMSERSKKERKYIRAYYENKKLKKKIKVQAKYAARPFMMPAVMKKISKFPAIWKTHIQQQYR
jgi:hypothetical protein